MDEPEWEHPEEPEALIAKRFDELNEEGWWHPEDGEVYLILFKTMVSSGIPRTEAFQYLHLAYSAAANEFGA